MTETNGAKYRSSLLIFYNRSSVADQVTVVEKVLGTFRLDYEYEIEYEHDFRISNQ